MEPKFITITCVSCKKEGRLNLSKIPPGTEKKITCPKCGHSHSFKHERHFIAEVSSKTMDIVIDGAGAKTTIRCPGCGRTIAPDAKRCLYCGGEIGKKTKIACPKCGSDDVSFQKIPGGKMTVISEKTTRGPRGEVVIERTMEGTASTAITINPEPFSPSFRCNSCGGAFTHGADLPPEKGDR